MNKELARQTIITLVSNSSFFRGMLFAKNAWGKLGFPDEEKEQEQYYNLILTLKDISNSLENKS